MFKDEKNKNSMKHWFEFAAQGPEMEQLFYDIRKLIEDTIRELLPPLFQEFSHLISVDIITALNGRKVDLDGVKQGIIDYMQEYLNKN